MPIVHCECLPVRSTFRSLSNPLPANYIKPGRAPRGYFWEIGTPEAALAFSAARAPARMFTMSLLPSVHAYSKIGPFIAPKGTMADQGLVQVDGSSTVNLYSIAF